MNNQTMAGGHVATQPAAVPARKNPHRQWLIWGHLIPCLVLIASLAAAYFVWHQERQKIERDTQDQFDARVGEIVKEVKGRLLSYEHMLQTVAGLFAAVGHVKRESFETLIASLHVKQNYPGIQGIGFSRIVPFAAGKKSGVGHGQSLVLWPAKTESLYFISFDAVDLNTLGHDYFAEPSRRYAMELARDTAGIAVSNKMRLPEEDEKTIQAGFRMYLPLYRNAAANTTASERAANVTGWVYSAFNIDRLMDGILSEHNNIAIDLYDGADIPSTESNRDRVGGESSIKLFSSSSRIDVGSYSWTLTARALPTFTAQVAISKLSLVAQTGVAVSLLLAVSTWLVMRRRYKLEQRTAALSKHNADLLAANTVAEMARQQATRALDDLRVAQIQLIQSEKMASLGQLVANVAHEINTPFGAIKSSGQTIAAELDQVLSSMPVVFRTLDTDSLDSFLHLIQRANGPRAVLSTREERAVRNEVLRELEDAGVGNAAKKADTLVQLNAQLAIKNYLHLLRHPECDLILTTAYCMASIAKATDNINTAVDRVSKIVFALKTFSFVETAGEMIDARLQDGIETALTIYQSQINQGTELVRQYESIPALRCLPNELNQVWTHLIHNALQAMGYTGRLTIGLKQIGNEAVVSVTDSGSGIPDEIRGRIFEPFFSTRPPGEGAGLGLDIVKKIVEKHKGRIDIQTEVGVGSTFSIYLPLQTGGSASNANSAVNG